MNKLGYGKGKHGEFAFKIGITGSFLSDVLNLKSGPSFSLILGISKEFPKINTNWLLTGNGSMTLSDDSGDIIDITHQNIIKQFRRKEDALEINLKLVEIEEHDPVEFGHVKGVVSEVYRNVVSKAQQKKKTV